MAIVPPAPPLMLECDVDPTGFGVVKIGGVDVSDHAVRLRVDAEINELTRAEITLTGIALRMRALDGRAG